MTCYHEPRTTGTKVCKGPCKLEKHVLAFSTNHSCIDGLNPWCRECQNGRNARGRAPRRIMRLQAQLRFESGGELDG